MGFSAVPSTAARTAIVGHVAMGLAIIMGCERPPVGGGNTAVADGRAQVDLPSFLQDRPAIGGKWYEYSVDGHVLVPKDETWIARLGADHVAFRITSIYDDDTGNSGQFHFSVARHDGDAWGEAIDVVAAGNVKDGNVCVALRSGDTVACDDGQWDLRLVNQSRLSVFAGFAVAEPAIVLHDDVRVARLDQVGLQALPSPSTLQLLNDAPDFATTEWRFAHLAPHLPAAGRVFGDVDRIEGHTWWVASSSFRLGKLAFAHNAETLQVSASTFAIDSADQSVDAAAVDSATLGDAVDVDLTALPVFLSLDDDGVFVVDADVVGPTLPGNTRRWDLAVVDDGGAASVLLSPGSAALNGSALGKDPPFLSSSDP
jgi:hypothetical protein